MLALLRRGNYEIQIIVWAGMPVETALVRTSTQANAIVQSLAAGADLTPKERAHLVGVGQSWLYKDVRRPVISIVVTKTE